MAEHSKQEDAGHAFMVFTADETAVAEGAADFLDHVIPIERLHRPNSADLAETARRQLGAMGWFGVMVPETAGGHGLSAVEHALFFREVGRRCGPVDILAQSLAALAAAGEPTLQAALIAGEAGVALAVADGAGLRVLGAPEAAYVLWAERDGARLFEASALPAQARPPLDPGTSLRFSPTRPADAVAVATGPATWNLGQLGAAAMLVGVAEAALDLIVEYAKVRETFGRKIGSYQAVRHPCADMALRAEAARSQLWYAAAALKGGRADAEAQLDAAKHLANQAGLANADTDIQLHGGIGVTDEHDAHLLLKRALLLGQVFGKKRALLARLLHASLQD